MPLRLLLTGYGTFDAEHAVGPSRWPHFDLVWIHDGAIDIRLLDRRPLRIVTGGGVLIFPDTPFAGEAVTESVRASVQHFAIDGTIEPRPLARLQDKTRGFEVYQLPDPAMLDTDFDRAMQWALLRQTQHVRDMRAAQLTLTLGILQDHQVDAAPQTQMPDAFAEVVDWLGTQVHRLVSLDEMAQRADQSTSHFRAGFAERFGVSPGAYYKRLRMNAAARLIRETHEPIKAIAQRFGYQDLANFYRAFRSHTGHAPAEHRRRFHTTA